MLDLSTPWRVQPAYSGINRSSPLSKGLRAAVVAGGRDLVTNGALAAGGGVTDSVTPHGRANAIATASTSAYYQLPFEISGAVSIVAIVARDASATASGPGTIATIATNKLGGQGTYWECNLGNGYGAGADINKPRFSTNAVGIGTIYADGVALSGNNPATTALTNSQFYVMAFSAASGASASGSGGIRLFEIGSGYSIVGRIPLVLIYDRALSATEVAAISVNPWQIFQPLENWLPLAAAGGAAALAGDAVSTASALAGLTTGIPVAGAALGVAGGSGALTTSIPLAGVAVAAASAGGAASTQITLSGAALAQAVSSAALSAGINMSVAAVAQAAADGTLATAIALVATALGQSSGSATLGGGAGLAANAASTATATASLTAQIRVSASAISQAAASAGLFTAIPLAANATAEASASATLGGGSPLATVAVATATAGGELTTVIPLAAAALAAAIAAGGLTVAIPLAGLAAAVAGASAELTAQIRINGQAAATAAASAALTAAGAPGMSLRFAATVARVCTLQPTVTRVLTLTTGAAHAH